MMYSIEPKLFKISFEKGVKIKNFTLGSISNWNHVALSESKYLVDICVKCENFNLPKNWDFRKGNYFIKNNVWYYSRKLGPLNIKFKFEESSGIFTYFPKTMGYIPFIFNSFYPVGYELSNIIIYEMLKKGFLVLRAASFIYKGKVIIVISPSCNGKTTLVRSLLSSIDKGVKYLSEDVLFVSEDEIIGFPPDSNNFNRVSNKYFHVSPNELVSLTSSPEYIIFYKAGNSDKMRKDYSDNDFPALEFLSYFSKSLASSMMYYENKLKIETILIKYRDIINKSKFFNISTDGYNSIKFMEYLDEIVS